MGVFIFMSIKAIINSELKEINLDLIIEGLNEIISTGSFTTALSEDGDVVCNIVNDELNADNCTLEENEYIEEGYREADELILLTTDIITYFGNANWFTLKQIAKEEKFTRYNLDFQNNNIKLYEIVETINKVAVRDNTKYSDNIKKFIGSAGVTIHFVTNIASSGLYSKSISQMEFGNTTIPRKDNRIYINLNDGKFIKSLEHEGIFEYSFTPEEFQEMLKKALTAGLKDTIVHELQHAYDDFISNGKYASDKRSKKYYANNTYNSFDPESKMSDKQYEQYLNLPHEYWARFSEALASIDVRPDLDDFNSVFNDFKYSFAGYETLLPNAKKRILNSLYKFYVLKKDKLNVNKVINEELNMLTEGLSDILYHFTWADHLVNILKTNKFATSSNLGSNADSWKDKGRFFFFSTQRTKGMAGYGSHHGTVAIVLDGRKLNYTFKGDATDYWNWSTKMADYKTRTDYINALKSEENEDRIVTNKPYIDNANKYIIEIHVWAKDGERNYVSLPSMETIVTLCKQYNIPVYFYIDEKDYKLQNKLKAVTPESLGLEPPSTEKSPYEEKEGERELYNAKWFFKKIAPAIIAGNDMNDGYNDERDKIEKLLRELLEQGGQPDQYDNVMTDINDKVKRMNPSNGYGYVYADDEYRSIQAEIHNHRGDPNEYLRKVLMMLIADMKKWRVKDLKEYFNKKFKAGIK
jgi:hypothetical protein